MIKLLHFDANMEPSDALEIADNAFAARVSHQLLHDACLMYDSNLRVGTAKTKSRAEVQGSSKKLYKQKGTGRARAGNRRTPVRVGGGHAFAKRPRDWYYRLPKKSLRIATRMALQCKVESGQCCVVDALELALPRTRLLSQSIKRIGMGNRKLLIVTPDLDMAIVRASNNIPNLSVAPLADLNARMIIGSHGILFLRRSLAVLGVM